MRYVIGTLAVVLLLLVLAFAIQNRTSVDVSFLAWSMTVPKFLLIMGTYVFGMLTGWGLFEVLKRAL